MDYPLITIGICTKNAEKTITKTLKSALTLDYPKNQMEIIIVDGLSTDKTLNIINNFLQQGTVKTVVMSDHGYGLGHARNLLVKKSKADYIVFIDADQYFHPKYLKNIFEEINMNNKIGAVRGVVGFTPCNSTPAKLEAYETYFTRNKIPTVADVWSFALGGSILRKTAIIEAGYFDPKITAVGEDTDLAFKLTRKGWHLRNSHRSMFYNLPRATWKEMYKQRCSYAASVSFMGKRYMRFKTKKRLLIYTTYSCLSSFRQIIMIFQRTHDLRCLLLPLKRIFIGYSCFLTFALR